MLDRFQGLLAYQQICQVNENALFQPVLDICMQKSASITSHLNIYTRNRNIIFFVDSYFHTTLRPYDRKF